MKDHFKHASILMTRHYAQIDDELLLLFELEKDRIRAESFDKVDHDDRKPSITARLQGCRRRAGPCRLHPGLANELGRQAELICQLRAQLRDYEARDDQVKQIIQANTDLRAECRRLQRCRPDAAAFMDEGCSARNDARRWPE